MDLYKDDPTSLPAKAQAIRILARALGVAIEVNALEEVVLEDADGNSVPLYPKET